MFIEFSFNYKILFLFIHPIIIQLEPYTIELYMKEKNILFTLFQIFLSHIFFLIFVLIFRLRTKKESNNQNSESNIDGDIDSKRDFPDQIAIEIQKYKSKKFRRNILFLIGLSVLVLIAHFINIYYEDDALKKFFLNTIGILFEIINFNLFSFVILGKKFYRHHFISFALIFFSLIILFIVYVIDNDFDPYIILYFFIYTLVYSLYFILGKKYLDIYYQSPYFMLFFIGVINSTGLLLYDILAYLINKKYSGIIIGFGDDINSFVSFIYFFLELVIKFGYATGMWLTIYYFTPCHFIISDLTAEMIKFYIRVATKSKVHDYYSNTIKIIFFSLVYFINVICSLIFNEVIIVKFCNLEYYTNKYIKQRERIDSQLLIKDNDEQETYNSSVNS